MPVASLCLILPSSGGCTLKFLSFTILVAILSVLTMLLHISAEADFHLVIKPFFFPFPIPSQVGWIWLLIRQPIPTVWLLWWVPAVTPASGQLARARAIPRYLRGISITTRCSATRMPHRWPSQWRWMSAMFKSTTVTRNCQHEIQLSVTQQSIQPLQSHGAVLLQWPSASRYRSAW